MFLPGVVDMRIVHPIDCSVDQEGSTTRTAYDPEGLQRRLP
jgi:hypothetical protein